MAQAYFKTALPNRKLYLSNGQVLMFNKVSQTLGYYPAEGQEVNDFIAGELRGFIARQSGGVEEISAQQYAEILEKKKLSPSRPNWRTEFSLASAIQPAPKHRGQQPIPYVQDVAVAGSRTPLHNPEPPPKVVSADRPNARKG